jgi:hypothetical protein
MTTASEIASRREARFTFWFWIASCLYTVGYCGLFAYRPEPNPRLILGMPSWVFWGVIAPWTVCTLVTCWYATFKMTDEDLGEDESVD